MARVLVTGSSGFIGRQLCRLLAEGGNEVVAVDRVWHNHGHQRIREIVASVEKISGALGGDVWVGDFEYVIHLAANAGVAMSMQPGSPAVENNTHSTNELCKALMQSQVLKRLVVASSSTVYGKRKDQGPFDEADPLGRPRSPYGASKQATESICWAYKEHGLPVVVVRPFSVIGPGIRKDLMLYKFAERLERNQPIWINGDGSIERDFTDVRDVAWGIILATLGKYDFDQYDIFNLGSGRPQSILTVAKYMCGLFEKPYSNYIQHRAGEAVDMPRTFAGTTRSREVLGWWAMTSWAKSVDRFKRWWDEIRSKAEKQG